ncbi:hypothetical protein KUCAC02_020220, partial [Chaenocephalus aceratus]
VLGSTQVFQMALVSAPHLPHMTFPSVHPPDPRPHCSTNSRSLGEFGRQENLTFVFFLGYGAAGKCVLCLWRHASSHGDGASRADISPQASDVHDASTDLSLTPQSTDIIKVGHIPASRLFIAMYERDRISTILLTAFPHRGAPSSPRTQLQTTHLRSHG